MMNLLMHDYFTGVKTKDLPNYSASIVIQKLIILNNLLSRRKFLTDAE